MRFSVSAAAVLPGSKGCLGVAPFGKQTQVVGPWVDSRSCGRRKDFDPFHLFELEAESIAVFKYHEPSLTGGWRERRVESEEANRLLSRLPVKPTR